LVGFADRRWLQCLRGALVDDDKGAADRREHDRHTRDEHEGHHAGHPVKPPARSHQFDLKFLLRAHEFLRREPDVWVADTQTRESARTFLPHIRA
jgi:hypothetical protein